MKRYTSNELLTKFLHLSSIRSIGGDLINGGLTDEGEKKDPTYLYIN